MFEFRILVGMAARAFSPVINAPTAAVLVIDQVQHLLQNVDSRYLNEGLVDYQEGGLPLIYRTANWVDFVQLAVTEIQLLGSSIQVTRRLLAILEWLTQVLSERRRIILCQRIEFTKQNRQLSLL